MKNIKIYINECPEDMLAWDDPWDLIPLGIISHENLKRFIKENIPFIKGCNKSGDIILSDELKNILLPEETEYQYKFTLNGNNPQFKVNGDIKTPEEIEEERRLEEEKWARWREAELRRKKAQERAKKRFFEEKPYEKVGDEFIDFCKKYVAKKGNTKGLVKAARSKFDSENVSIEHGENNGGLNCVYLLYVDEEAEEEVEIPFL